MDLDLNERPEDSSSDSLSGLESLLSEIETAHECIEERIRQLEAVTTRARQRQRWRQSQIRLQTENVPVEPITANVRGDVELNVPVEPITANVRGDVEFYRGDVGIGAQGTTFRTSRFSPDGPHLVAKALSIHKDDQNDRSNAGNFFDCNICLDMATDPILTSCGHLFCWPCFYQLSYAYSDVKECPVCMEEISVTGIIPIYGNGNGYSKRKCKSKECGLEVPPRPNAHRIEGIRQKLINSRAFYSPFDERIWQFSHTIAERSGDERPTFTGSFEVLPPTEPESSQGTHSSQVSRLLLQGAASFSSLSSALNTAMDSAERLIEDLESFIHGRHARRTRLQSSNVAAGGSLANISGLIPSDRTNLDTVADNDLVMRRPTSSFTISDAATASAVGFLSPDGQRTDAQTYNDSPFPFIAPYSRRTELLRPSEVSSAPSFSASRRAEVADVSDEEAEPFHVSRRRRLS